MAKKVKLADVLWDAANKWLPLEEFSCHAVAAATYGKGWRSSTWEQSTSVMFLCQLGCDRGHCATAQPGWRWLNDSINFQKETRGVRYMWLLLAMHVAEDEGIEIEVEA